jgi:hypothetical protein
MRSEFFQAGFFADAPVSDWQQRYVVPIYACPACQLEIQTHVYSYPHLDPAEALTQDELKSLGPKVRAPATNEGMLRIVEKLQSRWSIPVGSGTQFGPTRLKVTSQPKADFYVLPFHAGLFCRKTAAERLLGEGIQFEYVRPDARGKWAEEADFLELVVPVRGHSLLPVEYSFCASCARFKPPSTVKDVLRSDVAAIDDLPFFGIVETGTIILAGGFIATITRLGITGFVEDETLLRVRVADEGASRPTLAELKMEEQREFLECCQRRWNRAAARRSSKSRGKSSKKPTVERDTNQT